jgi:hypothetical protein
LPRYRSYDAGYSTDASLDDGKYRENSNPDGMLTGHFASCALHVKTETNDPNIGTEMLGFT